MCEPSEIPKAQKMELTDLKDLIHLITSVMGNDFSIYHYETEETNVYFVYVIIHDFYYLRGVPVLIFTQSDLAPDLYLKYQPNRNPSIEMTNRFENASASYIKIIKVKTLPECLDISL
ncbi:MAG: hypothetical protein GF329_00840 [Candidatus Lokiarchaeota archaeon]|nr:hypothetical protein [Candidatus Lokiarchaeota archaeon]